MIQLSSNSIYPTNTLDYLSVFQVAPPPAADVGGVVLQEDVGVMVKGLGCAAAADVVDGDSDLPATVRGDSRLGCLKVKR